MGFFHLRHPASLARVTVHVPSPTKKMATYAVLLALYAAVLPWVYSTVGQPYATALRELSAIEATNRNGSAVTVKLDKAKSKAHQEVLDAGGVSVMSFDEVEEDEESAFGSRRVKQKRRKERKKMKKQLKKDGKDDAEIAKLTVDPVLEAIEEKERLPNAYLPSAMSSFAFFLLGTATALFFLLQKWMVWFRVLVFYDHLVGPVHAGCFVQITPPPHRGKPAVTRLLPRSSATGNNYQFVFQRQKYTVYPAGSKEHDGARRVGGDNIRDEVLSAEEESTVIVGDGHANGTVRLIACPVDKLLEEYTHSRGLGRREVKRMSDVYGPNILAVDLPKFLDLWFERLLSPISVFQLFSSALWLLDAYWQYTMMTLVQILILESTTVFQRLKTLKTLKGMSVKAFDVLVFREGRWLPESSQKLVPGDLISLKVSKPQQNANAQAAVVPAGQKSAAPTPPKPVVNVATNIVPCDCVLVRGSAVVNEATLTGESIPQMKDAIGHVKSKSASSSSPPTKDQNNTKTSSKTLDMNGEHRVHTLFSGTSLVATSQGIATSGDDESSAMPPPPDGGCTAYVLRTGFNSSQGKLVQVIEFSTESVSGDSKETAMALLLLLCFALVSSGVVLKKGLEQGDRTTHELMVKCVIILTSVVPRQLPLQMAFAVNQAILALNKKAIMCTEPYRVPTCGKTTHCIFDKTGTLTTDQMLPFGVVNAAATAAGNAGNVVKPLEPVVAAKGTAAMVLGACHSIIHVEGAGMMGDPIETAALKGIGWRYDAEASTASPGDWRSAKIALGKIEAELQTRPSDKGLLKRKELLQTTLDERKAAGEKSPIKAVKIIHRHHFASKLKRMSVVARVEPNLSSGSNMLLGDAFSGYYCLVKGAPEAIKPLLAPGATPEWYDRTVFDMTHRGYRVLALAYRKCDGVSSSTVAAKQSRDDVESNLQFGGFIAFECKNRADSVIVVKALRQSNHVVAMATGDNALTALHVGKEVGICDSDKPYLVLTKTGTDVCWETTPSPDDAEARVERIPFAAASMVALAEKYSLATTEAALDAAGSVDDKVWDHVDRISIFARMSPQGKARVIRSMQTRQGHSVFMCGDGGNDVGALKQADVGLALLSGYGNTNTTDSEEKGGEGGKDGEGKGEGKAEDLLNEKTKQLHKRSAIANAKVKDLLNKKRLEFTKKVQGEWLQEEIAKRKARGDTGMMSYMGAVKDATTRMQRELMVEKKRLSKIHGNVFDDKPPSVESLLDGAGGDDTSIIRPGDASIAAPFTSRQPSIKSAIDLIRQGRCTLLNALQQQQTMMLECIISAYVLSALSLGGSRSSERQLMASSWLIMTASIAFSYATPLDTVSKVRPLKSVFHPAIFISILGQAAIHVFCMYTAVTMAQEHMGEERLKEVKAFFKAVRAGETEDLVDDEDEDPLAAMMSMWQAPFMPNLMNTVIFLVETSQIISVMFVNYKGRPWMKGLLENTFLSLSVFGTIAGVSFFAWEMVPQANSMFHLVAMPDDEFRVKVILLCVASIAGTFLWDRLCILCFGGDVASALINEAKATRPQDFLPMFMTAGKVFGGLLVVGSGNILIWAGLAYWWYRRRQAANAELLKE